MSASRGSKPPASNRFLRDVALILGIPLVFVVGLVIWWAPWKQVARAQKVAVRGTLGGLPAPRPLVPDSTTPAAPSDTMGVAELLELRGMLRGGHYVELTKRFRLLLAQTALDIKTEGRLDAAWSGFAPADLRQPLDSWVEAQPDDAVPRLVRADVLASLAYARRGEGYAAETSARQFRSMDATMDSAASELRLGLAMDPSLLPGYWTLIRIALAGSDRAQIDSAGAAALVVAPASFLTRNRMMNALLPRWGGSLELMQRLAEQAQAQVGSNPMLASLLGYTDMDRADQALESGDTTEALRFGESSLSHGTSYRLCVKRARMLLNARRAAEGLAAATCARNHLPTGEEARVLLSYGNNSTGVRQWPTDWALWFGRAADEARIAVQLAPEDSEVIELWAFIRKNARKTLGHEP